MRILAWHGYLLTGSGSNVYAANTARAWRSAGHDVVLMCQESLGGVLPYVDAEADMTADNSTFTEYPTKAEPAAGRCRVIRPNIGEILPVYVYDDYEGFTVKTFVDLSDDELEDYVRRNVAGLVTVIRDFEPEAIVVGHEVMGPYIARLACEATNTAYVAKLHGSALEFAVKRQDRYRHHAHEGLAAAAKVIGGSNYMVAAAASVVPGWESRAAVVNPGCDVDIFRPAERDASAPPTAGFVGKLIPQKGVHHFLAALGQTHTRDLRAVVVGYGGFEKELKALAYTMKTGNERAARRVAAGPEPLPQLAEFLDSPRAGDDYWERARSVPVEFTGRLEHGPLSETLPLWDVLVVPSVVPEAFGMVAAEAAASGVLPVVPRHSGIGEAGAALEAELDVPGLLTFDPDDPIAGIAERVDAILALPRDARRELELKASAFARERWSWETVAQRLLDLAS